MSARLFFVCLFFPVDESRIKRQKHLFWMSDITLEFTLSSCWDVVSYVCVNLWMPLIPKPQRSWDFPLLPSCTASACCFSVKLCRTLGFSNRQCLPCEGVDYCAKNPPYPAQGHPAHPWCSPHLISQAPFLCLNHRDSLPLWDPCGNPQLPCLHGCRLCEAPEWTAGQSSTWKISLSIPYCFYSGVLRAGIIEMGKQWAFTMSCELQSADRYNNRCESCL